MIERKKYKLWSCTAYVGTDEEIEIELSDEEYKEFLSGKGIYHDLKLKVEELQGFEWGVEVIDN